MPSLVKTFNSNCLRLHTTMKNCFLFIVHLSKGCWQCSDISICDDNGAKQYLFEPLERYPPFLDNCWSFFHQNDHFWSTEPRTPPWNLFRFKHQMGSNHPTVSVIYSPPRSLLHTHSLPPLSLPLTSLSSLYYHSPYHLSLSHCLSFSLTFLSFSLLSQCLTYSYHQLFTPPSSSTFTPPPLTSFYPLLSWWYGDLLSPHLRKPHSAH